MSKNCHTCKHLEYESGDEYGSGSGWFCGKRDPVSVEEESRLLNNMAREEYRDRYKRCFEPVLGAANTNKGGEAK